MNKFKVKTMANIMGISAGGLRKYEQYGIITPVINQSTGHREYTGMDMGHLINARRYRQFNYTLEQTAHLLKDANLEAIRHQHIQKAGFLEKEVQYALRRRERLMEIVNFIDQMHLGIQTFSIRRRPAMWLVPLIEHDNAIEDEIIVHIRKEWVSNIPSACVTLVYPYITTPPDLDQYRYAISIYEADALLWDQERLPKVELIEEQDCVYTYYVHTGNNEQICDYFKKALHFIEDNGLCVNGETLTRGVIFTGTGKCLYREVWIPVKKY